MKELANQKIRWRALGKQKQRRQVLIAKCSRLLIMRNSSKNNLILATVYYGYFIGYLNVEFWVAKWLKGCGGLIVLWVFKKNWESLKKLVTDEIFGSLNNCLPVSD